jgi:hypothetical protein
VTQDFEAKADSVVQELTLCQAAFDSLAQRAWQSMSIIVAGFMASLALTLDIQSESAPTAVAISVFAVGAVVFLELWRHFVERDAALRGKLTDYMSALERRVGFERQAILDDSPSPFRLRHWEAGAWPDSSRSLMVWTARLLQLGWVLDAAWRWWLALS